MKTTKLNAATTTARTKAIPVPAGEAKPKHTPGRAYIVATDFQVAVYDAAFAGEAKICAVRESARARMLALIKAQYGDTCPTYAQFRADRTALASLSLERGLVDDQVVRKPYNAAVVELYGSIPVSDSPAAVAKRLQRPPVDKTIKATAKPGDKGANERTPSEPETIGQFIAKFGLAAVLIEAAKILATEKATAIDAKTLVAVASHFAK